MRHTRTDTGHTNADHESMVSESVKADPEGRGVGSVRPAGARHLCDRVREDCICMNP